MIKSLGMLTVRKVIASYKSKKQKAKAVTYLFIVILSLIFCFPTIVCIAANPDPPKEITVVLDDNYPPYIFRDAKGHLQGILVDEWRLWEEKTRIKVDLQGMDWDKALNTIAEGNAHVIDTIFRTEERDKILAFSAPYASIDVPVFFHSSISGIKGVESLQGFTIGVKAGDACIDYFKKHGINTLREYPSYESIVRDAVKQKIKVFCIDAPPGYYYLYKMNIQEQYQQTAPLYTGQFHRAVRKERMDLLKIVEDGFAKISSKEHEEIEKGWRGSKIILTPYLTYILYLFGGLAILGAMLLLWNYMLRRKVAKKTVQLQEAIDSLEKSEEKYRKLFENANEAIFVVQDSKLVFLNPMTRMIARYSAEELMTKPFVEFVHPDDRDMVFENYLRRIKGEDIPDRYSFRIITQDSHIRWVELSTVMISWNGNPASLNFMVDVTDRKQAEEDLRQSEEKYRELIQFAPAGIYEVDYETGRLTSVNDGICEYTGYTRDEFLNTTFSSFFTEDSQKLMSERLEKLIAGEKISQKVEYCIRSKNGEEIWMLLTARYIYKDGKLKGATGVAYNITERKQAEEEKRRLEERLRRAEKMEALGQLAGGVAHDLNNVLGVLTGYSELLLAEIPEGQRSRNYVEKILKSTEKGAAIVQDLLTLARRGVTASEVIGLNDVVSDFIKTPVFEDIKDYHPQVTFRIECQEALLNIKGSPVHLEKALMNLLSNAAESIDGPGEVAIRTENRYLDKPIRGYDEIKEGDYVVLTVSDTGMGIPAESRDKIFEPFYTKKTMGRSGTGLGLSIVWGTVKDHNGHIDVQTEVGRGTAFTLYFPATREELTAPQRKVPIDRYMGNGESVLVVDDIAEQRDVACALLQKLGYDVHAVSSGEEAVEYLREHKADLIILDMIMAPGMDGLDTYRSVLKLHPKQKAIIVSGFSETYRVDIAQALGAGAYVRKPYVQEKLGTAVKKELNKKRVTAD
ncbi:MAG: PAS domain S-box protein [Smithellaceae bacterium]